MYDVEKKDNVSDLNIQIKELREENDKLKALLDDYAISLDETKYISNEELICRNEIENLKELSVSGGGLDDTDVKNLEVLSKILDRLKNGNKKKASKKQEKVELGKLLKIASESK